MTFKRNDFIRCCEEVAAVSKWKYKDGTTEILLLHWDYDVADRRGDFAFDESIPLRVEELVADNKVASLDRFIADLIDHAKAVGPPGPDSSVWEISKRMALDRGRRSAWEWVSETFLKGAGKIYDDVRPFRVCDLAPE